MHYLVVHGGYRTSRGASVGTASHVRNQYSCVFPRNLLLGTDAVGGHRDGTSGYIVVSGAGPNLANSRSDFRQNR